MSAANQAGAPRQMLELPAGKSIRHVLPHFSDVTREQGPIGKPCPDCAGCSQPFTTVRRPKQTIRVYPSGVPAPIILLYRLCGRCAKLNKAGGVKRKRLLAAIEKFVLGDGPAA